MHTVKAILLVLAAALSAAALPKPPTLYYDVNVDSLNVAKRGALARLVEELKPFPKSKLVITGSTDTAGAAAKNKTFSKRRATIVADALVKLGIPRKRLTVVGLGETQGLAPRSRKVTITIE